MSEPKTCSIGDNSLDQVLADYLKAGDAGQTPEPAALLARHPEWKTELVAFFAAQEKVDRWTGPLRAVCATPSTVHEQPTIGGDSIASAPSPGLGTFGDYELLTEIARGGMGIVYRARQMRLNRVVALKMILAGKLATETDVQRLKSEAEAAARLDHPHIVPIYEVNQHEGQHFFSMKLIDGYNLAQAQSAGPAFGKDKAGQRRAAALLVKVAQAVHFAHQHGILHRDLKPANILLDEQGEPHVSDFGLAKRVGSGQLADGSEGGLLHTADCPLPTALTQPGTILGTPSYMAPEQADGKQALTTAVDTYSLGAILYELTTGQPPFRGDTALDTVLQVLEQEAPRPRTLNPQLDYELETICLKCLEKDPNKRYPSAQALADDLERWLADEPILGRRTGPWERTRKWVRRHPAVSFLLGTTGTAAAGLLVLAAFWWHDAELRAEAVQDLGKAEIALQAAKNEQDAAKADVERLQKEADAEKDNLKKLQLLAELEKAKAKEARDQADRIVYAADMQFAHAAFTSADLPRLMRLLDQHRPAAGRDDLRGFEWHYLWRLGHRDRFTLRAHVPKLALQPGGAVNSPATAVYVAIAPDGKTLASAGVDGKLRLWDLATGQLRSTANAPSNVSALAFTDQGKKLQALTVRGGGISSFPTLKELIFGQDSAKLDKLDKLVSKLEMHTLDAAGDHKDLVEKTDLTRLAGPVAFSFSANPRAASSIVVGAMMHLPEGDISPVTLALAPDRKTLAIGGILTISKLNGFIPVIRQEGVIVLWDLAKREPRAFLKGHESMVVAIAFAPDGSLASAGFDRQIKLWNANGKERATLVGNHASALAVTFSLDGKRLFTGGVDGVVHAWDAATGKLERTLIGHLSSILSVAASNGQVLASTSIDGAIKVWDLTAAASPATAEFAGTIRNLSFAADGKTLLAVGQGGFIKTLDSATGKEAGKPALLDQKMMAMTAAVSPDGKTAAFAFYGLFKSAISVRDTADGTERHSFPFKGFAYALTFAPDGKTLACGTGLLNNKEGEVTVWQLDTGKELFRFQDFKNSVRSLAFAADAQRLVAGSQDRSVAILDAATGKLLHRFERASQVQAVALSRDGKLLAVADKTGVSIHQAQDGKEVLAFPTYSHSVALLAFSPDGKRLASGGGSGELSRGTGVKLWDVATGRETISLGDPGAVIRSLVFSPDGTRLVAASSEDSIIDNFGGQGSKSVVQIWEAK